MIKLVNKLLTLQHKRFSIQILVFQLVIVLAFIWLNEAAISGVQLLVPDDRSYSVLTAGKSSTTTLGHAIPSSLSNAISDEDKSSNNISEESNESSNTSSQSSPAPSTATASSAPASVTRSKPPAPLLSSLTSASGLSRGTLLISSSAQASVTAGGLTGGVSSLPASPVTSARSSATIQHRILPAESIPLPITISTRPGLRTVIAPETLTLKQTGIAKVGEVIQQIPTAVSHQRQTVVHNHARVVTPIVAPAVRTLSSQIVRAYHTPLVYAPHVVAEN